MYQEISKGITFRKNLLNTFILLYFARNYYLPLQSFLPNTILLFICIAFLFYSFFVERLLVDRQTMILISWIFISSFFTLATGNTRFFKNYVFEIVNLLIPLFMYRIIKRKYGFSAFRIYKSIIIISIFISIIEIIKVNNSITIYVGRDEEGYIVAYTNVLLALGVLYAFFVSKEKPYKYQKIFFLFAFIIYSISIIVMGYFIALVIYLFGVIALVTFIKIKNQYRSVFIIVFLIVVVILVFVNIQVLLDFAINLLGGTAYVEKLYELKIYFRNTSNINSLGALDARFEKYLISLTQILRYPLFGSLPYYNDDTPILQIVGYHSFVLDVLSLFGIIWGGIIVFIVFKPLVNRIRIEAGSDKIFVIINLITFFLILLFNNQIPSMGFAVYFSAMILLDKKRSNLKKYHLTNRW